MVAPNRITEFYTASRSEQCCNCREPLGDAGAYYVGRVRVCHRCHREAEEWDATDDTLDALNRLNTMLTRAGYFMLTLAAVVFFASVVSVFWGD